MDETPQLSGSWQQRFQEMDNKISLIYGALIGNELTDDGGLIEKVRDQNEQIAVLTAKVQVLEEDWKKYKWFVNRIMAGVPIATGVVIFVFKQLGYLK